MNGSMPWRDCWKTCRAKIIVVIVVTFVVGYAVRMLVAEPNELWPHRLKHDVPGMADPEASWFFVIRDIEAMADAARAETDPAKQCSQAQYDEIVRLLIDSASWDAGVDGEQIELHLANIKDAHAAAMQGKWPDVLAKLQGEKITYTGVWQD